MYTSMSVSCGNECLIRCLNIILSVHRRSWGSAGSSPYCAGLQQHTDSLPGKPPHPAMPADMLLRIQRRWWVLRLTWCLHLQRLRLSHLLWAFCNLEDEIDLLESKKKKKATISVKFHWLLLHWYFCFVGRSFVLVSYPCKRTCSEYQSRCRHLD